MSKVLVGVSNDNQEVCFNGNMLNRHGLIAGATGTGKTVTLQCLAEQFSKLGVSVFLTDIKGDLSGISKPGQLNDKIKDRIGKFPNLTFSPQANPVNFIDVMGAKGHPLRATLSSMGPLLLSRLLELNETQEGVLHIAFSYADKEGLLLLDLKDLQSLLAAMSDNAEEIKKEFGNITPASIGAIQRRLLVLKEQGAESFFGEPQFDIKDLLIKDFSGNGLINIMDATELMQRPRLYGAILLWMLSEVYEELSEVGDLPVPKLAFFFDEAHLIFEDIPKVLLDKIETVVRLVRSKGVGVYFITQSPDDVPDKILAQLGNRVQHALRSYTAADADRINKISKTFRKGGGIDIETEITSLGVGEALVSALLENGEPSEVKKVLIKPPFSQIGPISNEDRSEVIQRSPLTNKYKEVVDRESAYEMLKKKTEVKSESSIFGNSESKSSSKSKRQSPMEAFFVSVARSVGQQVGRQILRGVLGSITKKK